MITYKLLENLLTCSFEIIMLNSFSNTLLGNRRKGGGLYNLGIMVFTIITQTSINCFDNTLINLLFVPIIFCIYVIMNYSDSLLKCICIVVCFYMLGIAPEFVISVIFSLTSYKDAEEILGNELSGLCLVVAAKIITFIIVKCIEQIHKKNEYVEVENGIFCSLLVLPIASIVLLIGVFYADMHIPVKNKLFLEIGTGMLLFANAFMFYLFDKLVENMVKANKLERLYMKSETENRHYQQVEKLNEKHLALLHDIKKYLGTAAELIQAEENVKVVDIFKKLDIQIGKTSQVNYCGNKILNAILCERQMKANEQGIDYTVNLTPDLYVDYIDDIDLISIVGNLVDNAIEAASKLTENGFVKIEMFMANDGHFMIWEISNNFLVPPIIGKGGLITSKRNKLEHGIGIHTVERIVKEYDGTLKIEVDNHRFIASIIFQIDKRGL